MSAYLFKISRIVAVLVAFISLLHTLPSEFTYRDLMLVISTVLFIMTSQLYEKKKGFFSPSYVIYFIVFFLIHNASPYNYIYRYKNYNTLVSNPAARIPNDNYKIYFLVFLISTLIIMIQIVYARKYDIDEGIVVSFVNINQAKTILFTLIFIFIPLSIVVGGIFKTIFIPTTSYFIIIFLLIKESRKYLTYKIGFLLSLLIFATQFSSRYVLVRYVMPIGFAILLFDFLKNGYKSKVKLKKKAFVVSGFILVIVYGVFSEINKLNSRKNIGLDFTIIMQVVTEFGVLWNWIDRQIYRIFEIWTVLGGNIIDYANMNGFFYGTTYIKSLASILNFRYVSLPELSASMVGANYAQPGLVAEGYANFGVLGAVINVLSIYFLAEYSYVYFLKKKSIFGLLLVITPFSSIILDGGTFNSALFNIFFLVMTFFLSWLSKKIVTF